jgi:hypothetical protein
MGLFSCDVEGSSLETDDSCKYKFANYKYYKINLTWESKYKQIDRRTNGGNTSSWAHVNLVYVS